MGTLQFPAVLVPLATLREHGRFVPHEELRTASQLVFFDSVAEVKAFDEPTLFVSHQVRAVAATPRRLRVESWLVCCPEFEHGP